MDLLIQAIAIYLILVALLIIPIVYTNVISDVKLINFTVDDLTILAVLITIVIGALSFYTWHTYMKYKKEKKRKELTRDFEPLISLDYDVAEVLELKIRTFRAIESMNTKELNLIESDYYNELLALKKFNELGKDANKEAIVNGQAGVVESIINKSKDKKSLGDEEVNRELEVLRREQINATTLPYISATTDTDSCSDSGSDSSLD